MTQSLVGMVPQTVSLYQNILQLRAAAMRCMQTEKEGLGGEEKEPTTKNQNEVNYLRNEGVKTIQLTPH